jgi:hypothetical protein
MRALVLIVALLVAGCASLPPPVIDPTALTFDGVRLDPDGDIEPGLLREAMASYARHYGAVRRETRIFDLPGLRIESEVSPIRRDILGVIDFSKPSTRDRFYLINTATGRVDAYRVAHGRNSDPSGDPTGLAPPTRLATASGAARASNRLDSNMSAVGAYVAANAYDGRLGDGSVRLHGLDPTNSCTFWRAIVMHQARYMTPDPMTGQTGTSDGCLAVEVDERPEISARIRDGGFIYAGPASLHVRSVADGLSSQQACEAVRLKPELGPQPVLPGT